MRLSIYGGRAAQSSISAVGKGKAVAKLVDRMPSREVVAKVGGGAVGVDKIGKPTMRVVRKKAIKA